MYMCIHIYIYIYIYIYIHIHVYRLEAPSAEPQPFRQLDLAAQNLKAGTLQDFQCL